MKSKIRRLKTFITLLVLSSSTKLVYAVDCDLDGTAPTPGQIFCPFIRILNFLLIIGGAVFLIFIVVGALKMATALGDPKGLKSSRDTWVFAVLGVCIVLGVYAIFRIINTTLGLGLDAYFGPDGFNAIFDRINGVWRYFLEDVIKIYADPAYS